jgi:citrate synthase
MDIGKPTVIWEQGGMVCTSRTLGPDRIEIALAVKAVVIERHIFPDVDTASAFVLDKMHAYTNPFTLHRGVLP